MKISVLCGLVVSMALACVGAESATQVEQYHVRDLNLRSGKEHANNFMVDLSATFQGPNREKLTVPGFCDGEDSWKIRFSPTSIGRWRYVTRCEADPEMDARNGEIECIPNRSPRIHGGLRVDRDNPYHFIYEDGTRYFLLGFEADWIWALDMSDPDIPNLKKFIDVIAGDGFNHIVMNAYAHDTTWAKGKTNPWDYGPPEMYAWEGTNEKPDHSRMNVRFWQHYDRMMSYLQEKGVVAHIMLRVYNKLVNWPKNGSAEDELFYRYVVARYQAFSNVVWDFSKEAHNEKDADYKIAVIKAVKGWDAYGRLITVHDDNGNYDNGNYNICDFRSDQQHGKWGETILSQREARVWPVLNIEYGYERGVETLPTYDVMQDWQEVLRRTYEIICAGGYANYYYSNTSWDLVKWEPEPPGWKRYRILRDFFDGVEYWKMTPKGQVDGSWVLADEGKEYVIFAPLGGVVRFAVSRAEFRLRAEWLNIYTGKRVPAGAFTNGAYSVKCPFGVEPVVLHLRAAPPETRLPLPGQRGPWDNDLMIARSKDGLHFEAEPDVFVPRAHVPTLAQETAGRVIALFQWFPLSPPESFDRIAACFSSDNGKTWTNPETIRVSGIPGRHIRPCDPALVVIPDGKLRLYFTCDLLDGRGPVCLSALSEDGLNYDSEPGIRFSADKGVLDPTVVKIADMWHYYSPISGRRGSYHGVSPDGVNFKRAEDIVLDNFRMLGSAVEVEGGCRFYDGPRSAYSANGYRWRLEPGIRVAGPDPGIVRLKSGDYLIVYGVVRDERRRKPPPRLLTDGGTD